MLSLLLLGIFWLKFPSIQRFLYIPITRSANPLKGTTKLPINETGIYYLESEHTSIIRQIYDNILCVKVIFMN